MHPPEPTGQECEDRAVFAWEGQQCKALWYPQMGGYVARSVAVRCEAQRGNSCFDLYVWHNGDFPFSGEDGNSPIRIHHCMAEQFISFGKALREFERASGK